MRWRGGRRKRTEDQGGNAFLDQEKKGAIRSKRIKKCHASKTAQKETFSEKTLLACTLTSFLARAPPVCSSTVILQSKNYPVSRVGGSEWHGRWKIYHKHLTFEKTCGIFRVTSGNSAGAPSLMDVCHLFTPLPGSTCLISLLGMNLPSIRVWLH